MRPLTPDEVQQDDRDYLQEVVHVNRAILRCRGKWRPHTKDLKTINRVRAELERLGWIVTYVPRQPGKTTRYYLVEARW